MKGPENINRQRGITEKKYKTPAEQIPVITYIADVDEAGSVRYVSPQIEQILGFSPEEWLADPELLSKQIHPDDRSRVLAEYKSSREKCLPFQSEYRCLTYEKRKKIKYLQIKCFGFGCKPQPAQKHSAF